VLGGVKVDDSVKIAENVLNRDIADEVLTGGLVSLVFLEAAGFQIGDINLHALAERGFREEIERAKKLLENHPGKIGIPMDVVVDARGKGKTLDVKKLPTEFPICDIGPKTVEAYSKKIFNARTVVANGPMGVFEKKQFSRGTFEILRAMARSDGFTIIGGGHLVAAAQSIGVSDKIKHVSTGGGACISFLAGEKLPVLEMFEIAKGG
jgi:phosphoglycerate kinase